MSETLKYHSSVTVVDALPPGYAKWPAGQPLRKTISFTIDGAEVQAPEGIMVVDAAKYGGVEIPVFCYEPKLGAPVGACRMCLVEIEGIPKLQTACSTPVRDGMVVVTKSQRVIDAQNGMVEFLLLNHPLDCPVCDKGGECPLQDISYGWGNGESRMVEPKRHFEKPVALSDAIAIDRERCILCYRCVRFSQEVSEDFQLVMLDRGAGTQVGTFDDTQYVAPFSGNIIELCPVGALTSRAYRFRARPWDVEQGGSVCTLCPAQCNVNYTVRDEQVMRTLARDNAGVDDGWLCDKGRFAYQAWESDARITTPLVRQGDKLMPARWEVALGAAAAALQKSGARTAALAGGATTNEEGRLLRRLMLEGLGSPHFDSRRGGEFDFDVERTLADPALSASVPDVEWADALLLIDSEPVDDMPVLDLRIRKGVRRNGLKLVVASARPSSLDASAKLVLRYAPGCAEVFTQALLAALDGRDAELADLATRAGASATDVRAAADLLFEAARPVIVWSERMASPSRGAAAARALCNLADRLGMADKDGAGLFQVPLAANARGLREIGLLPTAGPGYKHSDIVGKDAVEIATATGDELSTLILMNVDPIADYGDPEAWNDALAKAAGVITFSTWLDPATERYADVVFPAEVGPEKEGSVTHPDGRIQRLRQTVERAGEVNAGWWVLNELGRRVGIELGVKVANQATAQIADHVDIYRGVTITEIGGAGVRWQERKAAAELPQPARRTFDLSVPMAAPATQSPPHADGQLRLGVFRSLWRGGDVVNASTLRALAAGPRRVELSPADGERLGVVSGDQVTLRADGAELPAVVALRDAVPAGTVFLLDTDDDATRAAFGKTPALIEVVK